MCTKISVIKAVRALTGFGLKEAKAIADGLCEGSTQEISVMNNPEFNREHFEVFRSNGITFDNCKLQANVYVRDIRNLTVRALKNGDYSVAQEVIELLKKLDPNGV
jgi:hypothetical protein